MLQYGVSYCTYLYQILKKIT